MSIALVRASMIRWARERSGVDARDLYRQFPKLPQWEQDVKKPMMLRRQDWMREFLSEQGLEALPMVGSASLTEEPAVKAQDLRRLLGFRDGWANDFATWNDALRGLRNAMEQVGILVVVNGIVGNNTHRKLDPEEFRGFVLIDDLAPLVFVN